MVAYVSAMNTILVSLTHLTSLLFNTAVLLSQPEFAKLVIFIAGFNLSFTLVLIYSLSYCYINGHFAKFSSSYAALVSTHCGGVLCYVITLNYALQYSS